MRDGKIRRLVSYSWRRNDRDVSGIAGLRAEDKPRWGDVPLAVRQALERLLGASVRRAIRAWGGYGPTPTFRLRLSDDRRDVAVGRAPSVPFSPLLGRVHCRIRSMI